jgi:hypothetical protein
MATAGRALNPLIPNNMERRDRNCTSRTSAGEGEKTEPSRAMCEEDRGASGWSKPAGGQIRLALQESRVG